MTWICTRRAISRGMDGDVPDVRQGRVFEAPSISDLLPLALGLLDVAGLQRRHRADRVLRLVLDPRHGAALARRSVRLPAPMERAACALWQRATRHAPFDRLGRIHLPYGVRASIWWNCLGPAVNRRRTLTPTCLRPEAHFRSGVKFAD